MEIIISKYKIRRGTNDQRKYIVFDQGEPVYTTDTQRLYCGTGTVSGGVVLGSKNHTPRNNYSSLSTIVSEIGDVVMVNNKVYQLTAVNFSNVNSWADLGTRLDTTTFYYDGSNKLTLKFNSISSAFLNSSTISEGIKVESGILKLNYDPRYFTLSTNKLTLLSSFLDTFDVKTIANSTLQLDVSGGISINPSIFGAGLFFNQNNLTLSSMVVSGDNTSITTNEYGVISMINLSTSDTQEWGKLTIDNYGRVTSSESSIYDVLQGDSSLSGFNTTNSLSSIFNGNATLSTYAPLGSPVTVFKALSSDGVTVIGLSSAGFITFEGNSITRSVNLFVDSVKYLGS